MYNNIEYTLGFDDAGWKDIVEQGIAKAAEIYEQKIRRKRVQVTYQAFNNDTDKVAANILKRKLEPESSEHAATRQRVKKKRATCEGCCTHLFF